MSREAAEAAGPGWRQLLLLPLLFYIGAKLSLAFAVMPEVLVMLWIPNSIVLAALLHYRGRRYLVLAALVILAEVPADYPTFSLIEAVLFGAINMLEVSVAYLLLRRWEFDPRFTAPADIAKFVIGAPVAGAFLSACAAAATYSHFRGGTSTFLEFFSVWWFSDGLGLLILTPLVLSLWPPLPLPDEERIELRWFDAVAAVLALAVLIPFAFAHQRLFHGVSVRAFLLIPPALYSAARFRMRVTTAVVAAIAFLVLFVTKNGQQPFGLVSVRETALSAQELLVIMSVTSLGIAALLSQHRRDLRELESRVRERTSELIAANARLQQLAVTDSLTGLLNRRALYDLLQHEIPRDQRYHRALALIVFDIDHFKSVNDLHGHAAGDTVLRHVAAVAAKVIRSADSIARYGGEEFVVVAPETDEASAVQLAERLRLALRSSEMEVSGEPLRVTASFGVAILGEDERPDQILGRADEALYAAKAKGRDRVEVSV